MPHNPSGLDKKIKELEKKHGRLDDISDELRIIGMEYSDIRSRIEATDILIDYVIQRLEIEDRLRRLNTLLAFIILLLVAVIAIALSTHF